MLTKWSADLSVATSGSALTSIAEARTNALAIKSFLTDVSAIITVLVPGNSGMTQPQITAANTAMNTALSTINAAVDAVTAAQSSFANAAAARNQAVSSYQLKLAGNSSQSIAAQSAKVAQAQAMLNEDTISSPIDGVVTKANPNVGEFAAAGQSGFSVQNSDFKIEAFVPEADIAKITVGNVASSTLDAYGSDANFAAQVVDIDPAETVLEGVPTYKVTLHFISPDARIRSGMTANLEILAHEANDVLRIPYRAIIDQGGVTSVRVVNPDGKTFATTTVTVGLKGSDGSIQVMSGLEPGNKVVTYVPQ